MMPEITQPLYGTTARTVGQALRTERIARQVLTDADALDPATASEGALISAVAERSEALRMVLGE